MRRAAKVDANHAEIVAALKQVGCRIQSLAMIGQGCADILAARNGTLYLLEVKDGTRKPSERRLTPKEQEWHELWKGYVTVVESVDDALRAVGAI